MGRRGARRATTWVWHHTQGGPALVPGAARRQGRVSGAQVCAVAKEQWRGEGIFQCGAREFGVRSRGGGLGGIGGSPAEAGGGAGGGRARRRRSPAHSAGPGRAYGQPRAGALPRCGCRLLYGCRRGSRGGAGVRACRRRMMGLPGEGMARTRKSGLGCSVLARPERDEKIPRPGGSVHAAGRPRRRGQPQGVGSTPPRCRTGRRSAAACEKAGWREATANGARTP